MRNLIIVIVLVMVLGVMGFLFQNQTKVSKLGVPKEKESSREVKFEQSKECDGQLTPSQTEGPYYKTGSPERINIRASSVGEKLTVTGFVFDKNCKSIKGAWMDFWQADGNGNYDNAGYNLRGHQFTDENGKYVLETVLPGKYPGRTPHIHVKVRAKENGPVLTSQLYFPGEDQNTRDSIFNQALVVKMKETNGIKTATFNFVVPF